MTVAEALAAAAARGLARIDAQVLLLHAIGRTGSERAWLIAHDDETLTPAQAQVYDDLCHRRADGEPVAYLTGTREFHGLPLVVDARVLDPRADTEVLVDWSLDVLRDRANPRVVDLGTGSGAIALAIARQRGDAQVDAVDRSADALAVAAANAMRLGLPIRMRLADWLRGDTDRYDLIVTNPPYIAEGDPHLPALRHEPAGALVAGRDGLDAIREIIRQAPDHLGADGWLLIEHGHDQAAAVRALLQGAGLRRISSRRDLAGIERCSGGQAPGLG